MVCRSADKFVQLVIGNERTNAAEGFSRMPLYTYRCNENEHEFQVRQRMTDDPLSECIVCGSPARRVVSSVGVVFKGSGFYVTDNRSSAVNGKGSKPKSKESKESSPETTPTPAAPAASDSSPSS
jgi:putative FmdB family regulatory protein